LELEFATTGKLTGQPLVRDAIAYALDRQELVDKVVGWANVFIAPSTSHLYSQEQAPYPNTPAPLPVNATPTTTVPTTVPTSSAISAQTFPTIGDPYTEFRDLAAAGYLRNAAGEWVDAAGHPLTLRMSVDAGDGWASQAATQVVAQLKAQGIAVQTISEPDATTTGQELGSGAADLALIPLHAGPFPSLTSAWYSPLLDFTGGTGAQDWSGYDSTKVDNLFAQAMSELNPVTAQPLYNQIDAQLWADMVALPLFAEPNALAWSNLVTGIMAGPYAQGLFSTILGWARLVREPTTFSGTPTLPS
jgi:peptide/nickel transport system substrate-binding protein